MARRKTYGRWKEIKKRGEKMKALKTFLAYMIIFSVLPLFALILEFEEFQILSNMGINNNSWIVINPTQGANWEIYDTGYNYVRSFNINPDGQPKETYIMGVSTDFDDDSNIEVLYYCSYYDSVNYKTSYSSYLEDVNTSTKELSFIGNDSLWYFSGSGYFNKERYTYIAEYKSGIAEKHYFYRSGVQTGVSERISDEDILSSNSSFNEFTFELLKDSYVDIYLVDGNGRVIKYIQKNQQQKKGNYSYNINKLFPEKEKYGTGILFAVAKTNNQIITKKLILIK